MVTTTETLYIQSAVTLKERYDRICSIISAIENQIVNVAAGNSDISEYSLDDGQTRIKTQYRSITEMTNALRGLEVIKQQLINQLNGRSLVLRDWRGLQ